jgi:hypothetical protein
MTKTKKSQNIAIIVISITKNLDKIRYIVILNDIIRYIVKMRMEQLKCLE